MKIKRVYEPAAKSDGLRILVDRLWPRGLSKSKAKIDLWLKELAPSSELRKWFGHDPEKWPEFQKRYTKELRKNKLVLQELKRKIKTGPATLLFGAKDAAHNNAVALKKFLRQHGG